MNKQTDSPSRMEILEGRVAVLERQIANAPYKDPEAKVERIFDIVSEELSDADLIRLIEPLKRGIRKALNHFYPRAT